MAFHLSRRSLLQLGCGAAASWLLLPRSARAALGIAGEGPEVLVWVFLVGGLDGLSAVVPVSEDEYYRRRPTLALPRGATLPLDGRFGLHPALAPLLPLWQRGRLAVVHAAAPPRPTHSHFAAIDSLCRGGDAAAGTWIERYLGCTSPLAGPRGWAAHLGAPIPGGLTARTPAARAPAPRRGARYPDGAFGVALMELAEHLRRDPGLRVATVGSGGWDTHEAQGSLDGWLADRLGELAAGIEAFLVDLGGEARRVTIVVSSEFGRSVSENELGGTEHGEGSVMLALGPRVCGGRVYGRWPGLAPERDALAATTDPRDVLAEFVASRVGRAAAERVFPGRSGRLGIFRA